LHASVRMWNTIVYENRDEFFDLTGSARKPSFLALV
jgi:hypothetical protein